MQDRSQVVEEISPSRSREETPAVAEEQPVSAIELLKSQHREVESLFAEIEALGDKAASKKAQVFKTLAQKVLMHSRLEEKFFYPELKREDPIAALKAIEEHQTIQSVIKRAQRGRASDEAWTAKIEFLKQLVGMHVEEEENELFPHWQDRVSSVELAEAGRKMQKMMQSGGASRRTARKTKRGTRASAKRSGGAARRNARAKYH